MGSKKELQKQKLEVLEGRLLIDRFDEAESQIILKDEESLTVFLLPHPGKINKKLTVYLKGNGSRVEILGAFVGRGEEKSEITVNVVHQGLNTSAYTHARTVLFDESRSYFSGLIRIEKGANKTTSLLENRVLILGEKARSESLPSLEIEADDVKASHASTTGNLDENQLFYLLSRGIGKATATRMLIEGFFEPVLNRVGSEKAAAEIRGEIWLDVLKI